MARITNHYIFTTWIPKFGNAIIMASTLPYKFIGHPDSVELFSKLGAEPIGRLFTGVLELVAFILIILPRTVNYGMILATGLMLGALASHITILGFSGKYAIGYLAIFSLILSATFLCSHRKELPLIGKFF